MSYSWPILSTVTFLPLLGAILIGVLRGDDESAFRNARYIALWTTLITFALSLILWRDFDPLTAQFQFVELRPWLGPISFHMGVDGISLPFVLLTTFLMPLCILASWVAISTRVKEYMIAFLVLETLMLGVFTSLDLVMFYLFFEGGLIPMFLIIGVWGGQRRVYASFKFFLYTLAGSLLMLLAIMAIYWEAGTTDIPVLLTHGFPPEMQTWLWFAFLASFAVKLPMWPVHTWLPDAHVEAPTAGSVILAGILLKMGGYGFLRFSIPMFPLASAEFAPLIFALSVVAIIYTSLVALAQEDMKKLIAYSSVAHMGFVTIGVFTLTMQGLQGGIFQMLSHGIVSAALFLCVGVIYDRMHTREISAFGGLADRMPHLCLLLHGVHAGQCRAARHIRLRRRVLEPDRRLPHQYLGRVPRHHRRHPLGGLRALSLSPHHLRQAGEGEPQIHHRPDLARGRGDDPARGADDPVRLLSGADSRCVSRFGRRADQELPSEPRRRRAGAARADAVRALNVLQSLDLEAALPELILAFGAMALLMLGVFTRRERGELVLWLAVAALRCSPACSWQRRSARRCCSATASSSIPSRAC